MDTFAKNIEVINSKYNDIYITYLLYRIWIKYKDLVIYSTSREKYNDVLKLLRIPEEYFELNIQFPLSNYMFYSDKVELDKVFLSNLLEVEVKMKDLTNINSESKLKKDYSNLMKYINEISSVEKLDEITNQFRKKLNLQYINVYIKGLSQ